MDYKPLTDVRYLVVHCAATPAQMDVGVKEIRLWHLQRGFFDIGYHKVIRRNGVIEEGRDIKRPGAHAEGYNLISYGVCLVGGVKSLPDALPEFNFTAEQMKALAAVLKGWQTVFPNAMIVGHHDLPSRHNRLKACPCFDVPSWVRDGMPAAERPTVSASTLPLRPFTRDDLL